MTIHEIPQDLSSPDYPLHTEQLLHELAGSAHRIVQARLYGKPVYIVTDMALAKQVLEDSKNFSFTPSTSADGRTLTEGTDAFMNEGLDSSLLSSSYEAYKEVRKLFNQAFKQAYGDRVETIDRNAKRHLAGLLEATKPPLIDVLTLCRAYWMPLIADVIGIGALPFADLCTMAQCSRTLVEANGFHGAPDSVQALNRANDTLLAMIRSVVEADAAPRDSALGYFLSQATPERAIDLTRTFALGGIDTGSGTLALQTHLLAANREQCARFLAMSTLEQRQAMTEISSQEAPTLYTPRFAVNDVRLLDVDIPAGSFVQIALYAINKNANPGFDAGRAGPSACPAHHNEVLPFGHARHKCPGENLARHLIPVFLDGFFRRYPAVSVVTCTRDRNVFSRSIGELVFSVPPFRAASSSAAPAIDPPSIDP